MTDGGYSFTVTWTMRWEVVYLPALLPLQAPPPPLSSTGETG